MKKCVSAAALHAAVCSALLCVISNLAFAQSVPPPWTATDIGSPALAGSATYSSGVFTIKAAGSDIWGSSDQFHFVHQKITGDVDVKARVDSLLRQHDWSKAGVMIRASLDADAAHGYTLVSASSGVHFERRLTSGASSLSTAGSSAAAPAWVRIVRIGSKVTAYWSSNGTTWMLIGSDTIALGTSAYVGIAVTSHNTSARTTATVSAVQLAGGGGVPSSQTSTDIGSPLIKGSTTYTSGVYTVKAGGKDIWDTADQFHYVYQPLTGDGEIVARVRSLTYADPWSKTGVMIRESLTAQSRHALVAVSAGKGYAFQQRLETGQYSSHTSGGSGAAPGWVKLVRTGDLFTAFRSVDGVTWTRIGSDTVIMGDTVYVGLATTSHNETVATTAMIDSLKITASTSTNRPPAVSLTAPVNGATFTAPAMVSMAASASDPENRMLSVDFYAGTTLVSRDSSSPYSASWSATTAGTYTLTAVAHDADGNSTRSAGVSVAVSGSTATSPPRYVVFTASANHATNVTKYVFKVYPSGANPATAIPVATSDLGKPTPASNGDITVDRATFFISLASGNYVSTVTAVGPGGEASSTGATFSR
jgi:regulation of enolase protein 1 (concanavalin A-like superfamily)